MEPLVVVLGCGFWVVWVCGTTLIRAVCVDSEERHTSYYDDDYKSLLLLWIPTIDNTTRESRMCDRYGCVILSR